MMTYLTDDQIGQICKLIFSGTVSFGAGICITIFILCLMGVIGD